MKISLAVAISAFILYTAPHHGWQRTAAIALTAAWAAGSVVALVRQHVIDARSERGRVVVALRAMDGVGWR